MQDGETDDEIGFGIFYWQLWEGAGAPFGVWVSGGGLFAMRT
jgi:hypothetical protein